jgi:hypothetical protein
MDTQKIGVREFRNKLATYLSESEVPLAITRHGDTIGFFLPAPRKRTEADRAAFDEAFARWDQELASHGIDEEEAVADFERERTAARR